MNGKSDGLIPTVPILFVLLSIIVRRFSMNASRPAHMGRISSGKEGGFKSSIKAAVSMRSPSITADRSIRARSPI